MKRDIDFNQAPLLLIWEITRSCELACRHCRASAENRRDPRELSTEQGYRLIDDVAKMGTPLIIFTGGDPLQREDLEDLIRYAKGAGLRVGTIPATTPRLTRERLVSLQKAGVDQVAFSIDGATEAEHDDFRRVPGSFALAMQGAAWARELGLPLQANTVFGSWNVHRFDALAELVASLGVVFWEVFLLVPTGRGSELQGCSAEQVEDLFAKIHAFSKAGGSKFIIKITEGQHYRRYVAQHAGPPTPGRRPDFVSVKAVHAGNGFCFVDHVGNICPSGFLPIECGNVREVSVIDVYRNHPVFRQLKDASLLQGRCGVCEFQPVCGGGSRARAYAVTGQLFAEDPACSYEPASLAV
ncbi:MAG TPA: radical SAM protein [Kiritimatiellia bacterium]|nr:radical SAM protein [Kiritimatiellia bacterium]